MTVKIPIPKEVAFLTTHDNKKSESDEESSQQNLQRFTVPHITKSEVEEILGKITRDTSIKNVEHYQRALTHKSILRFVRKYPEVVCPYMLESNERLEFIGDAVLNVIVADYLFRKFPQEAEGTLTVYRTRIVKGSTLASFAERLGLSGKLLMSDQTARMNGQQNKNLLENCFEAFVGALYYDRGFDVAQMFVINLLDKYLDKQFIHNEDNFKDTLLRLSQNLKLGTPKYTVVNEQGPPNEKIFTVVVKLNGERFGKGRSRKKKTAEQIAAQDAMRRINVSPKSACSSSSSE
jgi:ribonuclease-3